MLKRTITLLLFAAGLVACCQSASAQHSIAADAYNDKLRGMFLGEILGNYAGRPVEGVRPYGSAGWTIDWNPIMSKTVWDGDDDTCFEFLDVQLLAANASPTNADLRTSWTSHMGPSVFFIANRQARYLMSQGLTPPQTGDIHNNNHWYAIDSQITTESFGGLTPGMRQRAADLSGQFASISNQGYSVHAAQFYAAMYADAAFDNNVESVVQKGLEVVPRSSRTYEVITNVWNWYQADKADGTLNWQNTQKKVFDNYYGIWSKGRYYDWIESSVNTAMTTLALLYGQGDFYQTVNIGANAGFDADCNPATAAGLIGLMRGYSGLPAELTSRATDSYAPSWWLTGVPNPTTLTQLTASYQQATERQILLAGGSITGSGSGRMYVIPSADVVSAPVEKWDPAGPGGLVGAVQALGGSVAVSASRQRFNPADDKANLGNIINGITDVTYNGHRAYNTKDGTPMPAGGDWFALNFDRTVTFGKLVYYEGEAVMTDCNGTPTGSNLAGGFFTDLTVEALVAGQWTAVTHLSLSEPLDPAKFYQRIELTFDPVQAQSIRIRGTAGGTAQYTTCLQLEADGLLTALLAGDANVDGRVDDNDLGTLLGNWSGAAVSNSGWRRGDFSADGRVDDNDLGALLSAWTGSAPAAPEPATMTLLALGSAGAFLRRRQKLARS